jgi:hypothetical protein
LKRSVATPPLDALASLVALHRNPGGLPWR